MDATTTDTLLVADDEWVYGRFEDYFELPPLDCKPDPEAYKNKGEGVVSVGASGWQEAKRLSMVRGQSVLKPASLLKEARSQFWS